MSIIIKGLKTPISCSDCWFCADGLYDANDEPCTACLAVEDNSPWGCGYKEIDGINHTTERMYYCPLVKIPENHGRLIDIDKLNDLMYHEAFEMDSDRQKWDSGCWIRYKMYEEHRDNTPTIFEAERNDEDRQSKRTI